MKNRKLRLAKLFGNFLNTSFNFVDLNLNILFDKYFYGKAGLDIG